MLAHHGHKEVGEGDIACRAPRRVRNEIKRWVQFTNLESCVRATVTRRGVGIGIWSLKTEAMRIKKKKSELTTEPKDQGVEKGEGRGKTRSEDQKTNNVTDAINRINNMMVTCRPQHVTVVLLICLLRLLHNQSLGLRFEIPLSLLTSKA